jgi:transposase
VGGDLPVDADPSAMRPAAHLGPAKILNAIFYVLRGGIAWRLIPKDLPQRSTAYGYFSR